jgi:hypothetical protein
MAKIVDQPLFRMAKNRGIETYLINWNIFVSSEFAKAHNVCDYCIEGKHFVPQGDTSAITKDFYRESIRAVIEHLSRFNRFRYNPWREGMGNMTAEERQELDSRQFYSRHVRLASRKIKFIYQSASFGRYKQWWCYFG